MLTTTPGLVLHTTPYGETSVVARIFTRQLGVRSYLIKSVRSRAGRVKQNLLQPLSCLDMVVYDSHRENLNYIKEMSPRGAAPVPDPVGNALRFFMTEVLYKALREAEPMPDLWDYVEQAQDDGAQRDVPIRFLLRVAHHMGIEPLDNHCAHTPCFDLQEGRFVPSPSETTLTVDLSKCLHEYIAGCPPQATPPQRRQLLDAMLAYFQLHLSGFRHFTSHEILHTILR